MVNKRGIVLAAVAAALTAALAGCGATSLAPKVDGRGTLQAAPSEASPGVSSSASSAETTSPAVAPMASSAELGASRSVKVNATGSVDATPDRASFSVTVRSEGSTAAQAERRHVIALTAVLDALEDAGVVEKNTQTTSVGVCPIYAVVDYDTASPMAESVAGKDEDAVADKGATSDGDVTSSDDAASMAETAATESTTTGAENTSASSTDQSDTATSATSTSSSAASVTSEAAAEASSTAVDLIADLPFGVPEPDYADDTIVGYEMVTTISVSEVDVSEAGALIEACVEAGASGVSGPSYNVSDYESVYARALTKAVHEAREKAEVLAEAAGMRLGNVLALEEGYQNTIYRAKNDGSNLETMATGDATYELAPGQVAIEAQVSATFELL